MFTTNVYTLRESGICESCCCSAAALKLILTVKQIFTTKMTRNVKGIFFVIGRVSRIAYRIL